MKKFIEVQLQKLKWTNQQGVSGLTWCYSNVQPRATITTGLGSVSCSLFKPGGKLASADELVYGWLDATVTDDAVALEIEKNLGVNKFYAEVVDGQVASILLTSDYTPQLPTESADTSQPFAE